MIRWVHETLKGNRLALARVISKIENRDPAVPNMMKLLLPHTGRAEVTGITGPPGAGKSSLVNLLIKEYRKIKSTRVAVIAIDPSSPFTGGAILGDRIRMQNHVLDENVYIRSLGTRGQQGGLSRATSEVILTLDAAGFDQILVETAGVGQTELKILTVARTIVVVLVPESGDGIQVMKSGLMEVADIFVVNKSDRPQAEVLRKELTGMLAEENTDHSHLKPNKKILTLKNSVISTDAIKGTGIKELIKAITDHQSLIKVNEIRLKKDISSLVNILKEILIERVSLKIEKILKKSKNKVLIMKLYKNRINHYQILEKINIKI